MTDSKNVFECEQSMIDMVNASGEQMTAAVISKLYKAMYSAIEEKRADVWYQDRFVNDWHIELKKSPRRYRPTEDIMLDLADLWVKSGGDVRDQICRMYIGVSSDNQDLYKIMDSYHAELYKPDIRDDEKESIFSSVDALKRAFDEAITDKPQFRPSMWMLIPVYKYIAYGYNLALRDKDIADRLLRLGIHTDKGFCKMFEDLVICYGTGDCGLEMELQNYFYRGIPWYSLMFVNVMDRLWIDIFKEKEYEPIF